MHPIKQKKTRLNIFYADTYAKERKKFIFV